MSAEPHPSQSADDTVAADHSGRRLGASAERSDAVLDPGSLSAAEGKSGAVFRADRLDYLGVSGNGVGPAAAGRALHRQAALALCVGGGDGLDRVWLGDAGPCADVRGGAGGGGDDRTRLVDLPPRGVADRAAGCRDAARLCAIPVSGRRQRGLGAWPAGGGLRGDAARASLDRMVRRGGDAGHGAAVAGRGAGIPPLVRGGLWRGAAGRGRPWRCRKPRCGWGCSS